MQRRRALISTLGAALGAATPAASAPPVADTGLPRPGSGRIERLAHFPSRWVTARHVDVWLPAGYSPKQRHPVVYMHDGQMLFDPRGTWNRQAWQVDVALQRWAQGSGRPAPLVVGVWNVADQRYAEYFPEKILALAPPAWQREYRESAAHGRLQSDAYLRFLVEELKPAIDARYSTQLEPAHTVVAGASMGGLISVYALCEHPQVFGAAAGLSAHWVGVPTAWGPARLRNAALPLAALNYLAQQLPPAGQHRLWIDRGTDALDSLYAPALALVQEVLRDRGYTDADARVHVAEGTAHSETAWGARVQDALAFLLRLR